MSLPKIQSFGVLHQKRYRRDEKMKERPIIMTGESVRAILDGRKTQTRRVIKPQPELHKINTPTKLSIYWTWKKQNLADHKQWFLEQCPYGRVGDRLWVRERIRLIETLEGGACGIVTGIGDDNKVRFKYEADGTETDWIIYPERLATLQVGECVARGCYKEAARIWLEITGIRVERVQDITSKDCLAEGYPPAEIRPAVEMMKWLIPLWNSLNAKRGFGWDKNPWVRVIEFKRTEK